MSAITLAAVFTARALAAIFAAATRAITLLALTGVALHALALAIVAAHAAGVVAFIATTFEAAVRHAIGLRCRRRRWRNLRRLLAIVATATVALTVTVAPFATLSAIATVIITAASVISVAPLVATPIVALRIRGRSHECRSAQGGERRYEGFLHSKGSLCILSDTPSQVEASALAAERNLNRN